jgi:Na+/melibiose symporter-like transporter
VVEITKIWAFETLLLFYYTQVLGLSGSLAGLALLLIMAVDAISDPLVGQLSDRNVPRRFGRRHTFMFASLAPAAVFFFLLFSAPRDAGQAALFSWLLACSVGLRISLTFFAIPYSAQLAELANERAERTKAAVYRMLVGAGARLLLIYLAFNVFFAPSDLFPRGQENPQAYVGVAFVGAALILAMGLLSSLGTYRPMRDFEAGVIRDGNSPSFTLNLILKRWLSILFSQSNANTLVAYSLILAAFTGYYGSLSLYLGSYFWELTPAQLGAWNQAMVPGMVIMLLACTSLLKRMEPKHLMLGALAVFFLSSVLPLILCEAGLLERTGAIARYALYASKFCWGLAFGALIVCVPVMATESADRLREKSGVTQVGLVFGLIFFATKAGNGIGGFLAGGSVRLADISALERGSIVMPPLSAMQELVWLVLLASGIAGGLCLWLIANRYAAATPHEEVPLPSAHGAERGV